jgi:hypothetical protein
MPRTLMLTLAAALVLSLDCQAMENDGKNDAPTQKSPKFHGPSKSHDPSKPPFIEYPDDCTPVEAVHLFRPIRGTLTTSYALVNGKGEKCYRTCHYKLVLKKTYDTVEAYQATESLKRSQEEGLLCEFGPGAPSDSDKE